MSQTRVPTEFRLGDRLLQRGLISVEQLEQALEAQVIYGGHLGTCLLEKGFVGEGPLGEVLAESSGLQLAKPELFENVPPFVVESLPERMARKHLAVPFRREDKDLHVAMMDAKDLRVIDELAFASGCRILPWVAPEARILQALERYYRLPRRPRYISICRQLDEQPAEIVPVDGANPQSIVSGTRGAHQAVPRQPQPSQGCGPAPIRSGSLQQVTELLSRVRDEGQAVRVALDFAAEHAARTLLFRTVAGAAELWESRGCSPTSLASESRVTFSITREPLFGLLVGQPDFAGSLPAEPFPAGFYERLRLAPSQAVVLLPLAWDGLLQALLYADAGPGAEQTPDPVLFRRLAAKLACSLRIARLRTDLEHL